MQLIGVSILLVTSVLAVAYGRLAVIWLLLLGLTLIFIRMIISLRQRLSSQAVFSICVNRLIAQSAQVALVYDSKGKLLLSSDGAKQILKLSGQTPLGEMYSPFAMPDSPLSPDGCALRKAIKAGRSIEAARATIWPEKTVGRPATFSLSSFQAGDVERWLLVLQPETLGYESIENTEETSEQSSLIPDAFEISRDLIEDISQINFEDSTNTTPVFEKVLERFLLASDSEYGFIGRVSREAGAPPFLTTLAITDISWDIASREVYQTTGMVFSNLDTLFGQVITSEQVVVSNSPASDERAAGVPPGHPALNSFLGIPLIVGGSMIGMVGLANRKGGYDTSLSDSLQIFIDLAAQLTHFFSLQIVYKELGKKYQNLFDEGPVMYVITESRGGEPFIADCNQYFCDKLQ
ncbi:MAG: GAF domain-containing protein [SAR86 cluster bacterium]|uniref:GAF domain-containing protein n=1 Tax=SAR86 cluster bacterium TaxID=2030880 RepID=A0A972VZV8_9GAMM|nr:GAF domain-containing protein [SAR86 cluster bacterium]